MSASTPTLQIHTRPKAAVSLPDTEHTHPSSPQNEEIDVLTTTNSLLVVVQRPHKRFFLLPLRLAPSTTARNVMNILREARVNEISRIKALKPLRQALWNAVVEIANLSTFRHPDLEARDSEQPLEVILCSRIPSPELTTALHRPWLMSSSTWFADQYPNLFTNFSSSRSCQALMVGQELNKYAVFWILFVVLLISLGIGLAVGLACSRADLAFAITGGLTGIISVLTALLVWMLQ